MGSEMCIRDSADTWLTTLQTLAAGSVPAALHKVILPWVQQRSLSARRENPQSNIVGVIPSRPLATTVPLPSSPTHHGDTKTVTAAVIQCSTLLWAKRNALLAAHSSHIPSLGQQHKRCQRSPVEHELPLPPVDSRIEVHGEIPQQPSNSHSSPPLSVGQWQTKHWHPTTRTFEYSIRGETPLILPTRQPGPSGLPLAVSWEGLGADGRDSALLVAWLPGLVPRWPPMLEIMSRRLFISPVCS